MSALHTPGPWPLSRTGDGKRYVVGAGLVEGPGGYEVAEVYSDDCDPDVAAANARLIASAPDLLAALVEMVEEHIKRGPFDEPLGSSEQSGAINRATAAIAKARGQ